MTFQPIKIPGWVPGDILTSVQMNTLAGLNSYITMALDKTGDNFTNGGGISGVVDVLNSGTFRLVNSGGTSLITLSGTTLEVKSGAVLQCDTGSTTTLHGTINVLGSLNVSGLTAITNGLTIGTSGSITMLSGTTLQVDSGATVNLLGNTLLGPFGLSFISTSSSTYDATTTDCVILCVTTSIPITVVLPAPSNGRFIVVKDQSQNAVSNHITILPHNSENIDGVSSETISTNSGCFQYISDGTNWHSIAKI